MFKNYAKLFLWSCDVWLSVWALVMDSLTFVGSKPLDEATLDDE